MIIINSDFQAQLEDGYYTLIRDSMEYGECWFVTLSFAFNISRYTAEQKVKEWLRRLGQVLKLKEHEMQVEYIFAYQSREVLHCHLIVAAKGLHQLDHERWEDKWLQITGQAKHDDDYDSDVYYTGQGSACIKEIVNDESEEEDEEEDEEEECYTPERVANYLVARHSYEVCHDLQFYGRAFKGC